MTDPQIAWCWDMSRQWEDYDQYNMNRLEELADLVADVAKALVDDDAAPPEA